MLQQLNVFTSGVEYLSRGWGFKKRFQGTKIADLHGIDEVNRTGNCDLYQAGDRKVCALSQKLGVYTHTWFSGESVDEGGERFATFDDLNVY